MNLEFWRDLSLWYLLLMQIVTTILMVVVLYFVVRGVMIARRKATEGVKLAQYYVGIVRTQSGKIADKAAEPLVRAHAEAARDATIVQTLLPGKPESTAQTKEYRK